MNQHRYPIVVGTLLILVVLCALSACRPTPTPTPTTIPSPTPPPIPSSPPLMELGVNSLNDPVQPNGNASEATTLGASRDRWAVEWFWVEQPWREDDPAWGRGKGQFGWQGVFYMSHLDPASDDIPFDVDRAAAAESLKPLVVLHGAAATAAQYPVLLIPSGGLYGGANPKSRCPNPIASVSIAIVTLSADGAPVWALVIVHWSLIPPACPACITA